MGLLVGSGTSLGGVAGGAATARLLVVISGNTSQLEASLAGATASVEGFNKNAIGLGNSLIRGVTLPVLGLAGAALMLAANFQSAMARVAGLTPIVAQVKGGIDSLTKSVLSFAKDLPTSPTELANALYFAGSAGLTAAEALDVVRLSAQGAAIGMGDAADISKVLIFALNNFRDQGLTAAKAMDVLTAAIREGTAEPADMAIALGRLLPIAKQAGISFSDVAASVAALTNIGLPTRVAVTSLRALFTELIAPTQRATSELQKFGITTTQLRTAVMAGPVVAFNLLQQATQGNVDSLHAILPQIRGFTAFLGIMNDKGQQAASIMDKVRNSTGVLNKAFEIISQTTQFKFGVALNDLRIAGIALGTQLFPVFNGLASVISDFGQSISNMPSWGQKFVVFGALAVAALGPILKIYGTLINSGTGVFTSLKSTALGFTLLAAAASLAIGSLHNILEGNTGVSTTLIAMGSAATVAVLGLRALSAAALLLGNKFGFINSITYALGTIGPAGYGAAAALAVLGVGVVWLIGKTHELAKATTDLITALDGLGAQASTTDQFFRNLDKNKLAETFQQINTEAGQMGVSLGKALGPDKAQIIADMATQLALLQKAAAAEGIPQAADNLTPFVKALQDAQGQSITAGQAFINAGLSTEDFTSALNDASSGSEVTAQSLRNLIFLSGALGQTQKDFTDVNAANILSFQTQQQALQSLADVYGVTTDEVAAAASQQGVNVTTLTSQTSAAFAETAGWVDKTTGEIVGDTQKIADAIATATAQEAASFMDAISLFDKLPDKIKESDSALLSNLDKQASYYSSFANNVQTLLNKGIDPTLLSQLVQQGPAMVAKFVTASKAELGKMKDNYAQVLGAVDAAILAEGNHQSIKGTLMATQLAQGIMAAKGLPTAAAYQIIGQITLALNSGKLSQEGEAQVIAFAQGIARNKDIPKSEMGAIVLAMLQRVKDSEAGLVTGGANNIDAFVRGILSRAGIPPAKAKAIAAAVKKNLIISGMYQIGSDVVSGFIGGMLSQIGAAVSAAARIASSVKSNFTGHLLSSPEYFTYHTGADMMNDLVKGLEDQGNKLRLGKLRFGTFDTTGAGGRGAAAPLEIHSHVHVQGSIYADDLDKRVESATNRAVRRAMVH